MGIPLDLLMDEDRNIYELTVATIRRAHQIGEIRRAFSSAENGAVSEEGDKVVSQAIGETVSLQVKYKLDEK